MRKWITAGMAGLCLMIITSGPGYAMGIIVGNMGLEELPPNHFRRVVGTWLLKETHCTRSIEAVQGNYYMVSRCKGIPGDDKGLPISKLDDTRYIGKITGWAYEILEDGHLKIRTRTGAILHAEPHARLWP